MLNEQVKRNEEQLNEHYYLVIVLTYASLLFRLALVGGKSRAFM